MAKLPEDRAVTWQTIVKEIPAFVAQCESFRIPKHMVCSRFGVKAWHHPELMEAVNDEPENLMILPPLDGSIMDKMHLFKCSMAKLPEDRAVTWQTIVKELPAFVAVCESFRIPKHMVCSRFGVKAWHHPELMEAVNDVAPEARLLALIDEVLETYWRKNDAADDWQGSAEELEKQLRASSFNFAVDKLLHYSSACGVYLGRIAAKLPGRFSLRRSNGKNIWRIQRP